MQRRRFSFTGCDSGQALIESVLILPLLLIVLFNAINFGYFFIVALNVASAPRSGALYAVMGGAAPAEITTPSFNNVRDLTRGDLTGAVGSPASTPVQVCTKWIGVTVSGSTITANCQRDPSGSTSYTPSADPNSPNFVLHRVDVTYSFKPLIRASVFNLILPSSLCPSSGGVVTCTFHRQTSIRVLD